MPTRLREGDGAPVPGFGISSIPSRQPGEHNGLLFSAFLCASASLRESKKGKISARTGIFVLFGFGVPGHNDRASGGAEVHVGILNAMIPIHYVVQRVCRETRDTFTIELAPSTEESIGAFEPGQFNMLYSFGIGEVPVSISGDPAESGCLVHTIRAVGPVTQALCDVTRGDTLGVRGPFGTAWPVSGAVGGDALIVAGGLGLAPLRPALYGLLRNRSAYGRIALIYGARSPEDLLYRREIERWRSHLDLQIEVTVDGGRGEWRGHVGVVTTLIGRLVFDPARTTALVCGPEVMMRFTVLELLKQGLSEDRVFLSLERNMKCGMGLCGHCQLGPFLVCRDGPILTHSALRRWMDRREA